LNDLNDFMFQVLSAWPDRLLVTHLCVWNAKPHRETVKPETL